jgi:hypothetical protein
MNDLARKKVKAPLPSITRKYRGEYLIIKARRRPEAVSGLIRLYRES